MKSKGANKAQVQPVVMQSQEIQKAMKEIAQRKSGNKKLVYCRSSKTIVIVDRSGNVIEDTGIHLNDA